MTRLWKMGPFIRSTLWLKKDFFAGDRVIGILLYRHKKKLLYSFNLSVSHSLDSSPTEGSLWRRGKAFRNAKASPR